MKVIELRELNYDMYRYIHRSYGLSFCKEAIDELIICEGEPILISNFSYAPDGNQNNAQSHKKFSLFMIKKPIYPNEDN